MIERRRHERVHCCIEARWQGLSGKNKAKVTDFAQGGCFVESLGHATPGECITIEFNIDNEIWFTLKAEVIYCFSKMGFGIRFYNLRPKEEEMIAEIIIVNTSRNLRLTEQPMPVVRG